MNETKVDPIIGTKLNRHNEIILRKAKLIALKNNEKWDHTQWYAIIDSMIPFSGNMAYELIFYDSKTHEEKGRTHILKDCI